MLKIIVSHLIDKAKQFCEEQLVGDDVWPMADFPTSSLLAILSTQAPSLAQERHQALREIQARERSNLLEQKDRKWLLENGWI